MKETTYHRLKRHNKSLLEINSQLELDLDQQRQIHGILIALYLALIFFMGILLLVNLI